MNKRVILLSAFGLLAVIVLSACSNSNDSDNQNLEAQNSSNRADNIVNENVIDELDQPVVNNTGNIQAEVKTTPTVKKSNLRPAPGFSLKDYNGNTVSLSDFAGKPVVINSWAAWCPFCLKELPDFVAAQEKFGDAVTILAIDRAESLKKSKSYTDDLAISDKLVFLLDPKDSFYQSIGGFSMPETIFVNSAGEVFDHKRGFMTLEEINQRIQALIDAS